MLVLRMRDQLRGVAKKWVSHYGYSKEGIAEKLNALDVETATPEDVSRIIGNSSWVCEKTCHECGSESWDVVQLGEEPDYESNTANICRSCLEKALDKLKE